jgi:phage tail-like protein
VTPQPPFTNHRFKVEVEGIEASGALAAALPETRIVTGSRSTPKLECGSLTITRGQTMSSAWYDWWNECRSSTSSPDRIVVVVLLDAQGADALRWKYTGARPIAYRISTLDALQSDVLAETLEIAVKTFDASFGPAETLPKQRKRRAAR